jgi:adenylate kinase family enzyme
MQAAGPRIHVVGPSSSGKSTLAEELARRLDAPYVELDALYWRPGWVGAPADEFRAAIEEATAGDCWVAAGNYREFTRPLLWPRLTNVVWLDLPLPLLVRRMLARSWRRWRSHELLWGTNYESFWRQFYDPQGVLLYTLRHYRARRRSLTQELGAPEHSHIDFVRLRSQQAIVQWIERSARP